VVGLDDVRLDVVQVAGRELAGLNEFSLAGGGHLCRQASER